MDFTSVIMQAVINTKNKKTENLKPEQVAFDQLDLALKFKQLPIFKKIMDDMEGKLNETYYEILLQEAILRDQPEFIELLMNEDNASCKTEVWRGRKK